MHLQINISFIYLYSYVKNFKNLFAICACHKLRFVVYPTNVAENRCKLYTHVCARIHTLETGWLPCCRTLAGFYREEDASGRLFYLTRCQVTWSSDARYVQVSYALFTTTKLEDYSDHIRPLGDAELTEHIMIPYRCPLRTMKVLQWRYPTDKQPKWSFRTPTTGRIWNRLVNL